MKRIVTTQQMKDSDSAAIHKMGMPSLVLMERAALAVCDTLIEEHFPLERVLVLCGSGNNGGDGLAVGRLLHLAGYSVTVCELGRPDHRSTDNRIQRAIAENYGVSFTDTPQFEQYTTIIDAVFGIGLSRELDDSMQQIFDRANHSGAAVMAVDIPSGVEGNTGRLLGCAMRADVTVTFAFEKPGLLLYPGAACAGRVLVSDIGIYEHPDLSYEPDLRLVTPEDAVMLPKRNPAGNKGTFGKALLVAGSRNMSGASYLASAACFRTGAGMVKLFTPESNREILQRMLPEMMLACYEEDSFDPEDLQKQMDWADVIGIGPGLGQSETSAGILEYILKHANGPLVIDADGLNLTAKNRTLLKNCRVPVIVTPHMGEMAGLTGKTVAEITDTRLETAGSFADTYHCVCVLKDARTVTATGEGHFLFSTAGNSGMATAGSGDVLTGMLTGLLAQGMKPAEAAGLGVWLHGRAGDLAASEIGQVSMTAQDLITHIPMVMREAYAVRNNTPERGKR